MEGCCKPFHCRFVDGLLAVLYFCAIIGSCVVLAVISLDQEMNKGHCILLNLNASITNLDFPQQFDRVICQTVKYISISQIVIPLGLIIFSWVFGFSAFVGWWIFQAFIISLHTIISLIIGVAFTTTLLIFCGQLYWTTKEPSCIAAASIYDEHFQPNHGDKVQITFDHVIVAVASTWFMFFSFLLAAFALLVHSCTKYYQNRLKSVEQQAQDVRLSIHHDNLERDRALQPYYISEFPPAYNNTEIGYHADQEEEPLIRF